MKPLLFTVFGQNGQQASRAVHSGWNSIPLIHAGVWVRERALEFWNACLGAGELYISRIEILFDGPVSGVLARANWHVDPASPNVLVIGTGLEYVRPRGVLTVRWDYALEAPITVPYGATTVTWAASQKRDLFTNMKGALPQPRETGLWAPGVASPHKQCDPAGADERNGVCGWEQDGEGFVLRSDLVMERMGVGCLDQNTGQPVTLDRAREPDYTLDTGWTRHGQLYAFCAPVVGLYNETRRPIVTWAGVCAYRALMLGLDIYNSYTPFNGQHRKNALGHVLAAAQCGDETAIFCLAVLANDAAMAENFGKMPRGGRDFAWRIDAWAHSRAFWRRAQRGADDNERAMTESGAVLRGNKDYGFNPSPQSFGMPADWDSDQIMERIFTIYTWGLFGKLAAIKKAIAGMPWPCQVKFVGVGITNGPAFPTYQHPCGNADFFPPLALGVWAWLEPESPDWRILACNQPTPEGFVAGAGGLHALRDRLLSETRGREQTAMLLAAIERVVA